MRSLIMQKKQKMNIDTVILLVCIWVAYILSVFDIYAVENNLKENIAEKCASLNHTELTAKINDLNICIQLLRIQISNLHTKMDKIKPEQNDIEANIELTKCKNSSETTVN